MSNSLLRKVSVGHKECWSFFIGDGITLCLYKFSSQCRAKASETFFLLLLNINIRLQIINTSLGSIMWSNPPRICSGHAHCRVSGVTTTKMIGTMARWLTKLYRDCKQETCFTTFSSNKKACRNTFQTQEGTLASWKNSLLLYLSKQTVCLFFLFLFLQ